MVFRVSQRAVRERYAAVEKMHKRKIAKEESSFGLNDPDLDKVHEGIQEIVDKSKDAALHYDDEKNKAEEEKEKAENVRSKCLETFSETKKRLNGSGNEGPKQKVRDTGRETIARKGTKRRGTSKRRTRVKESGDCSKSNSRIKPTKFVPGDDEKPTSYAGTNANDVPATTNYVHCDAR